VYAPRKISALVGLGDAEGVKLYGISASGAPIDAAAFWPQFQAMKAARNIAWTHTPAFAIFHQGEELAYLVLCWWGNGNELFVRVAVQENAVWVVDSDRYSFCLWDLEVMWHERQSYIRWLYSGRPDLPAYRRDLMPPS